MTLTKLLTRKPLIALAAASSAVILLGAFIFQSLGYAPCDLCLTQRYPHAAAIAIGILALLTGWRFWPWLGALAAATTGAVGVYHSGVERKLWAGPSSCTAGDISGLSTDDLMASIMEAPLVRCDEIPWEMFGITMANLNAVGSFALAVVWIYAATRRA